MSSLRMSVAAALVGCLAFPAAFHAAQTKPQTRDPRLAQAQQPAGKGVIAGVVASADAGRAIRRARVTISGGTPRVNRSVQSDEQGAFRFADLPPGDYTLTTSKGGFVETIFGQKQPGSGRPGTPIRLAADQELTRISMPIARGGVITGAVFDETGEPAFGVSVRLFRWVMESGDRTLESAGSATTDDRGIYRFPALRPGEYLVSTEQAMDGEGVARFKILNTSGDLLAFEGAAFKGKIAMYVDALEYAAGGIAPTTGFANLYYPGTTEASAAATLAVTVGEERSGIDFRLQPVPIARISGVVTAPDGPAPGADVQLISRAQPPGIGVRSTRAGKDGSFSFAGVTPGQYVLFARSTPKGGKPLEASPREAAEFLASAIGDAKAPPATEAALDKKRREIAAAMAAAAQLWAMTEVPADGRDVTDVPLVLQPGVSISGRVLLEGGTGAPPNLTRMSLTLSMVGQHMTGNEIEPPPAAVDANGDFTIRGVFPGRYRLAVAGGAPSGYVLRSAIFGGQDVLDVPFQLTGNERPSGGVVTFTTRATEVNGAVMDAAGQPAPGVTVIAFATDERFWTPESRRIQAVRPSGDGKYVLKNLPPGEYRLVAVDDVEPGRWFDPTFLRTLPGITTVTVTEGSKVTQDIRVK